MRSRRGGVSCTVFHSWVSAFSGRYRLPDTNENAISVPSVRPQNSPITAQMPSTSTPTMTAWVTNSTSEREYTRLRTTRSARRK